MTAYRVVYLAAGIGQRLRPLTYNLHKCLLEIQGKTIVEHLLDCLISSEAEIDRVHIIIGHYGYKFRDLLGNDYKGLKIQFSENPLYKITGAAQSLYTVSHILRKHPCIILEGDHYLDPELIKKLIHSEYENCILVDENLPRINFDEEVLAYGYGGLLQSLKWMPPYPEDPLGEALTIFKLSKAASNALASTLEHYLLEDGPAKKEIIEPFNRLMKSHDMQYMETNGREWIEIDFVSDLEQARTMKFVE